PPAKVTTPSGRRSLPERSVVYGRNPVQEALRGRRRVLRVWETDERPVGSEPLAAQVTASTVSRQELERICGSPDPQGLGAEGKGMRPRVRAACDQLISLPLSGRMRSLNVSAAAAVLLYEAGRRRRDAQG